MSSQHNTNMYLLVVNVFSCALQGLSACLSTKSFGQIENIHYYATMLNRMDSCVFFFLPVCTVKFIKFELKLNMIFLRNFIGESN